MGKGCGGVGSTDQGKCTLGSWVVKGEKRVSERCKSVCYSVVDVAIEVRISDKAMDHFSSCTH